MFYLVKINENSNNVPLETEISEMRQNLIFIEYACVHCNLHS